MFLACPVAGIAAFFKFSAGRWAPFINPTGHLATQFAGQCGTATGYVIGAAHAGDGGIHLHRQPIWHRAALFIQFLDREIDTKAGAANAALGTGSHVESIRPKLAVPAAGIPGMPFARACDFRPHARPRFAGRQ